jgi:hypothetical protein
MIQNSNASSNQPMRLRVYIYHVMGRGMHHMLSTNPLVVERYAGTVENFDRKLSKQYSFSERLGSAQVESPSPGSFEGRVVENSESESLSARMDEINALHEMPRVIERWWPPFNPDPASIEAIVAAWMLEECNHLFSTLCDFAVTI